MAFNYFTKLTPDQQAFLEKLWIEQYKGKPQNDGASGMWSFSFIPERMTYMAGFDEIVFPEALDCGRY